MRIHIVSIDDSLISIGARKVCAYMRGINPDTHIYYLPLSNFFSLWSLLAPRYRQELNIERDADAIAEPLADADVVAFSSMTHAADATKAIIAAVRRINPRAYIVWGGIHAILVPEDAIQHADAVCTGEGEFAFAEFFDAFRHGRDYTGTRNFWFNQSGDIIRNSFRPLMTSDDMERLPFPAYADDEHIYKPKVRRFTALTSGDYLKHTGLTYYTIWTVGCPFHCTFCGNTKFIENDRAYTKLRFPSPRWIVDEINTARKRHPHISNVSFTDDSLMALPMRVLEEFAAMYQAEVGLPFFVPGIIPSYVKREKVEVLLEAGMYEVRMGVQSGSQRTLDFYKRPASPGKVLAAADIFGDYSRYLIPPAYDFILDNPIETRDDIVDTLELIYKMRRPFTLNLYSLRVQPNTMLARQFEERKLSPENIADKHYKSLRPTTANCIVVLLAIVRPPRWLFKYFIRHVRGVADEQPMHPSLFNLVHALYLIKRGFSHLWFMDFSRMPGRTATWLWRLGAVGFWHRHMVPRFKRTAPDTGCPRPSLPGGSIALPVLAPSAPGA